jgi:GT2 family glycosyltransferase
VQEWPRMKAEALRSLEARHAELDYSRSNPDPSDGLSIVIPSYNAVGIIEPLLGQLAKLPDVRSGSYEVILSDDASTDGTPQAFQARYPWLRVVESAANTGFGSNANRGIAAATKGYLALVNTDIELIGNPFPELMATLFDHQECFALMPLVFNTARQQVENLQCLREGRGLIWNADLPEATLYTRRVRAMLDGAQPPPDVTLIESILCGACFVCSTGRGQQLGGFDKRFAPFYWEDVDLGVRALKGGVACDLSLRRGPITSNAVLTSTAVLHRHSQSIEPKHGSIKYRFLRLNQLRFYLRHVHWWIWHIPPPPFWGCSPFPWWVGIMPDLKLKRWRDRGWWLLRGVREAFGGDPVLRAAYFKAARGRVDV